jgi:hypothetical protein
MTFKLGFLGKKEPMEDSRRFTGTIDVIADGVSVGGRNLNITVPGAHTLQDYLKDYRGIDNACEGLDISRFRSTFESMGITEEYLAELKLMAEDKKTMRIQVLQGDSTCFHDNNPVLKVGEWVYHTDNGKLKIGDGVTHWRDLKYKVDNLDNYQLISEKGKPNGYAPLDVNNKVPKVHLPKDFSIKVVTSIDERNNINGDELYEGMLVFVVDATADNTVDRGSATYIWANEVWIKVSEIESMDVDTSVFLNKNTETIDVVKDGNIYVRVTHLEKNQINNNKNEIQNNVTMINNVRNDFQNNYYRKVNLYTKAETDERYYRKEELYNRIESDDRYYTKTHIESNYYTKTYIENNYVKKEDMKIFVEWLFKCALRKADVLFGGDCTSINWTEEK